MDDMKTIVCLECGNDKFDIKESLLGGLSIGCANCGNGHIFGAGLSARTIVSILKGEDKVVKIDI